MDNNFTVLLVEDDLNDIFLVKRAFKIAQIPTPLQVVTDGLEAMSYLKGSGKYGDRHTYPLPHLMVMDIRMPRKSGFEVLEWVKENPNRLLRRIPIVVVSSSENPEDVNRAYDLGANCYLTKPPDWHKFRQQMERIGIFWGEFAHTPTPPER